MAFAASSAVQVMQTQCSAHIGVNGQMVLLETLERRQFVSIEAQGIVNIRSDRNEVSEFWLRYGMLRSQALNTEESACLTEH
ncbi:MAG: Scr1 family TA system antitoxin-like transcriptional regulator, partial [Streptomyces sp.]|nr:Scr1 family TA system antitoxin-like transcriptional regulator [Streptomyces sp.]